MGKDSAKKSSHAGRQNTLRAHKITDGITDGAHMIAHLSASATSTALPSRPAWPNSAAPGNRFRPSLFTVGERDGLRRAVSGTQARRCQPELCFNKAKFETELAKPAA